MGGEVKLTLPAATPVLPTRTIPLEVVSFRPTTFTCASRFTGLVAITTPGFLRTPLAFSPDDLSMTTTSAELTAVEDVPLVCGRKIIIISFINYKDCSIKEGDASSERLSKKQNQLTF